MKKKNTLSTPVKPAAPIGVKAGIKRVRGGVSVQSGVKAGVKSVDWSS